MRPSWSPLPYLLLGAAVAAENASALAASGPDEIYVRSRSVAITANYHNGTDWKKNEGSGFLVHPAGFVLSAKHVLGVDPNDREEAGALRARGTIGGRFSEPKEMIVVASHPELDVVLLQIVTGPEPQPFEFFNVSEKDDLPALLPVVAVGFPPDPDGKMRTVPGHTRTAYRRGDESGEVDNRLENGFSGGPVLSERQVVGIIERSSIAANTYHFVPIPRLRAWIKEKVPPAHPAPTKGAGERPQFVEDRVRFDRPSLQFDVTFKNPGRETVILTHVGVETSDTQGSFECLSARNAGLSPLADYLVPFHVADPATMVRTEPPLPIAAGDAARFRVTLRPDDVGACGTWSTDVAMVLQFDDGTRLSTPKQRLTRRDLDQAKRYSPPEEQIMAGLHHRNPTIRATAVEAVPSAGFSRSSECKILAAKLTDPSEKVGLQALAAIVRSNLNELSAAVAESLDRRLAKSSEAADPSQEVSRAIATLDALNATDRAADILRACLDERFRLTGAADAASVLERFQDPEIVKPLVAALSERHDWMIGKAAAKFVLTSEVAQHGPDSRPGRYSALLYTLLSYRSQDSLNFLSGLFDGGADSDLHKSEVLRHVASLIRRDHLVQDPFIRQFEVISKRLLGHADPTLRCRALRVYASIAADPDRSQAVKTGLADPSVHVRIAAVEAVADFELKSQKPELEKMLSALTRENSKDGETLQLKRLIEETIKSL